MEKVIIIGAGLSGLSTAYYLKKEGISAIILEARGRTGGRILTLCDTANESPVEMGATWFADKHTFLMSLVKELNVNFFHQYRSGISLYETTPSEPPQLFAMPEAEPPSYRIAGGTSALIRKMEKEIGAENILKNMQVTKISDKGDFIEVTANGKNMFAARQVVVTIPPNLLAQEIEFTPALPNDLLQVMQQTHTWMSDAIKFAFVYERPFWREMGYSGTLLSQAGVVTEMYDHTNVEENRFSLKGFQAPYAATLPTAQREAMAVRQLKRLLGDEAGNYLSYVEKVWADDPYTHAAYKHFVLPHQNSGHHLFQQAFMNGKLYISGSETSPYFGGYMDGAVYSGLKAATSLLNERNATSQQQ